MISAKIILGDCLDKIKNIQNESIDLTVTSPPYDNLRTYNGNISQWSFEKFQEIAKELYRVTKDGGVVVWVVGDATIKGSETGTSFRQALWFMDCGFNLHDTMIWAKDGGGAIGSNKCYTQNFEYMLVFSKGIIKTVNIIRDKPNLSYGRDRSGTGRRKANGEKKIEVRKPNEKFSRRNNWWYIPVVKNSETNNHPAPFPEKIANDHIISWSNPDDIVFDPFMGSGTTGKMALLNRRNFIGIEIDEEYFEISKNRISNTIKENNLNTEVIYE